MQLEAGKKYTDRRGRVYGPLVTDSQFYAEQFGCQLWYNDGRITPGKQFDMDLVAEYVEPVQPEYRMLQDGELIQDGDEYQVMGGCGRWEKIPHGINRPFSSKIHVPHRRLVEPAAPVESPDDWVILDPVVYAEHVPRVGIDQFQGWDDAWTTQEYFHSKQPIGLWGDATGGNKTRCRRKDLPPVPPKTRTVVLKEWIVGEECGYFGCIWASEDPSKESDDLVFWGWASETGNTRTVEIPVT